MSHTRRSLIRSSLSSFRRLWQLRRQGRQEMRRKLGTHFEQLESRALLTGSPSFQTIADQTVLGGAPTWLGIDGTDTISGPLTYSVSVTNQKNSQGQATTGLLQAIVPTGNKSLVLSTSGAETGVTGQMTYQLFDNLVPNTTQHIETLVNNNQFATNSAAGINSTFYRIAYSGTSPFVIQGGPSPSTSSLGAMNDEFNPDLQFTSAGLLAMAKSTDDTGDSQIFVTAGPTRFLDFQHTIFGVLTEGDAVRQAIQSSNTSGDGQPPSPISISGAQIITDTQNAALELKAAVGASGSADVTVTVTDSDGQHFQRTFHVTVTPDPFDPGPYLNTVPAITGVQGQPINVQLSATDVQHKPATDVLYYDATKPASETVGYTLSTNHSTGVVTITPPANFAGTFHVSMGVSGETGSPLTNPRTTADPFDTQNVLVSVAPLAPTSLTLDSGSDNGISASDKITSSSNLTFNVGGLTAGATVQILKGTQVLAQGTANGTTQSFTVTNAGSFLSQGTNAITVTQTVSGVTSAASAPLTITFDTTAPTFTSTAPTVATLGNDINYTAHANDAGGAGGVVYSLQAGAPTGVSINSTTGLVTWTPTASQFGAQSFTVVATDAAGNSGTQTVNVTVPSVDIQLTLTKLDGTPLTSLAVGQDFLVHVFTQDTEASPQGVGALYTNLAYDSSKASVSSATAQKQTLNFVGSPAGGTFSLSFTNSGGTTKTTSAITYDSTTAATTKSNIQAALDAALGAGFATVASTSTTSFDITIANTIGTGGVAPMVLASVNLTDSNPNDQTTPGATFAPFASSAISFPNDYNIAKTGRTDLPGTVSEVGATTTVLHHGDLVEAFNVRMHATAAGTLTISSSFDSHSPAGDVLTFGPADAIPAAQIHFGTASIDVAGTFNAANDTFTVNEDSQNNSLNPLANDTSIGGATNTLTITAVGSTDHGGTVTISSDSKTLNYTPAALYAGPETFTYTVKNQNNESHTATVTMTVAGINHAPTAVADTFNVPKNTGTATAQTLDVLLNDTTTPDTGETLRISAVGTASQGGTVTIASDGKTVLYTPKANFTGTETFTYTINDRPAGTSGGLTSQATVTVHVGGLVAANDTFGVAKNAGAADFDVLANDLADTAFPGSTFTITAVGTPNHGGTATISQNGTRVNYTPANGFQGTETFTYTINDGHNNATGTVTMNVNGPPTANNDGTGTSNTLTVFQGTNTLDVLANDTSGTTPAGTLTIDSASLTQPAHGTVSVSSDGTKVIYKTTDNTFQGTDSFTYKAKGADGQLSSAATVSFNVQPFQPSTLSGFAYFDVNNDGAKGSIELGIGGITITLTGTPTAGDTTPVNRTVKTGDDGSYKFDNLAPGSYTITETQPLFTIDGKVTAGSQGGTTAANKLTITLAQGTTGIGNNFGEQGRALSTISIRDFYSVGSQNYAFTAFDSSGNELWHTLAGSAWSGYSGSSFSLVSNKTQIQFASTASTGSVSNTVDANTLPVYQAGTSGSNSLYFVPANTVTGSGATSTSKPVANADSYSTNEDAPLTVTAANSVLKNDVGTSLQATIATQPTKGAVTLNSDGTFTYTPTANANGTDTFTYTAKNGSGQSTPATVTVTINAINDAPARTGTLTAVNVNEDSANTTAVSLGLAGVSYAPGGGTDEASQTLTIKVTSIPSFITLFKADGTTAVTANTTLTAAELAGLKYKTIATVNGTGNVVWTVQDSGGTANGGVDTITESLAVTVGAVNDAPVRTGSLTPISVSEDSSSTTATSLGLTGVSYGPGGGTDEAGQTLTVKVTSIPSFVTLFKADGTTSVAVNSTLTTAEMAGLKYKTVADANGTGTLTWSVQDSGGTANGGVDTITDSLAVTVTAVNDAPLRTGTAAAVNVSEDVADTTAASLGLSVINYTPGGGSDESGQSLTVKITNIPSFIDLFKSDGTTAVNVNDTLTVAELQQLTYKTIANANGSSNLVWTVQDNGGTSSGGVDTLTDSLSVTVIAVNDVPVRTGTFSPITVSEDLADSTPASLGLTAVTYGVGGGSDETANQTLTVKITNIPTFIKVFNGGTQVHVNDTLTTAQLAQLTYETVADGNGTDNFTWTVQDNGGTANGGVDTLSETLAITVLPVADTPAVTDAATTENTQTSGGLVLTPNAADGGAITSFQITAITNGTLFLHDGTTQVHDGDFITVTQAGAGLEFTPTNNFTGTGSFQAQASLTSDGTGLGGSVVTANITVIHTPSVTDAITNEDTQSSTGLVITADAADTAVTNFQITTISHGTLFLSDGTTQVHDGDFITASQGAAGLKFTPAANYFGNATFHVQAAMGNTAADLITGSVLTATIEVDPVADTPSVTDATTTVNTQTTSGLVIAPNAVDAGGVMSFQITNITNGTLFLNDGTTQVNDGDFITAADAAAGLKFTPDNNFTGTGSFDVQASLTGDATGLGGDVVTATIDALAGEGESAPLATDVALMSYLSGDQNTLEVPSASYPTAVDQLMSQLG